MESGSLSQLEAKLMQEMNDVKGQLVKLTEAIHHMSKGKAPTKSFSTQQLGQGNPEKPFNDEDTMSHDTTSPLVIKLKQLSTSSNPFEMKGAAGAIEVQRKAVEGADARSVDPCLASDVIFPEKHKFTESEKYKGIACPYGHVALYCRKMAEYGHDEKLLMRWFQKSLTGAALRWYMQLEDSRIRGWKDMANAFIEQYKHNWGMVALSLPKPHGVHPQQKGVPKKGKINQQQEPWVPLPLPLSEVYEQLLQDRQIAPLPTAPLRPPYPNWYNVNATCAYHSGAVGHFIEDCPALKRRIQQLIKLGCLKLEAKDNAPSVHSDSLLDHENNAVKATMVVETLRDPYSPSSSG